MSEREEKLIEKIIKMQKAQNLLNLDDQIEKYKKEIKDSNRIIEKTESEISKLSTQLKYLKNKNENIYSENEKNIANKKEELDAILRTNKAKKTQLEYLKKSIENFKNQDYILELMKYWNPQTMFKYIQLCDKKHE